MVSQACVGGCGREIQGMPAMLTIYGRKSSFNVQKVMWFVGELNIAGRALNPHGRVPVMVDGDVTVWESHTILRYLAARWGGDRNDDTRGLTPAPLSLPHAARCRA